MPNELGKNYQAGIEYAQEKGEFKGLSDLTDHQPKAGQPRFVNAGSAPKESHWRR